jgi:CRISPR-associated protein Csx16
MTRAAITWFVSRHPGAVAWAQAQGLPVEHWVPHLDVAAVQAGDTVAGTLPMHLAAQVCARGARYLHLSLDLPPHWRGQELDARQISQAGARLERYIVQAVDMAGTADIAGMAGTPSDG